MAQKPPQVIPPNVWTEISVPLALDPTKEYVSYIHGQYPVEFYDTDDNVAPDDNAHGIPQELGEKSILRVFSGGFLFARTLGYSDVALLVSEIPD